MSNSRKIRLFGFKYQSQDYDYSSFSHNFPKNRGEKYYYLTNEQYYYYHHIDCWVDPISPDNLEDQTAYEEIISQACQPINSKLTHILIPPSSPFITWTKEILPLPQTITTISYSMDHEKEQAQIDFLNSLPPSVSQLHICESDNISMESFKKVISYIPQHVTSILIPNIFLKFEDNDHENKALADVFASFPSHITTINVGRCYEPIKEARLKKVLLGLPFSVKELNMRQSSGFFYTGTLSGTINMDEFREKNYFPQSYTKIANSTLQIHQADDSLFDQAKRLLMDYTKCADSKPRLALFFSFHWARNHVAQVNQCLQESHDFEALYKNIKNIKLINPAGSLARRIRYIEALKEKIEEKKIPSKTYNSN